MKKCISCLNDSQQEKEEICCTVIQIFHENTEAVSLFTVDVALHLVTDYINF